MSGISLNVGSLSRYGGQVSSLSRSLLAAGSVFTGAAAAYALRVPSGSTYSGPLLRVRRSSDNAESNIGAAGPQLAQNRFFAADTLWTKNAGVTISGGAMVVGPTVARIAGQNMGLIAGGTYKVAVVFDKTGTNAAATLRVSTSASLTAEGASQTVVVASPPIGARSVGLATIVATESNLIIASSDGYFTGSILSVSVQQSGPYQWLDEHALLTHVKTANGFVSAWYDQSGYARHWLQATASNQPSIVAAGVVRTEGGLPTVVWDSANGTQHLAPASAYVAQAFFAVRRMPVLAFHYLLSAGVSMDYAFRQYSTALNAADLYYGTGSPPSYWANGAQAAAYLSTNHVLSCYMPTPTSSNWAAGTTFMNRSLASGDSVSEMILFASTPSTATRQTLERNQGAAFGITVA